MDKGPKTQTVTQNTAPWSGQAPYLSSVFNAAKHLYQQGAGEIAPFSGDTQNAFGMIRGMAGENPLAGAMDTLNQTATGGFMNANPYLDATFDRAAGRVSDQYRDAVSSTTGGFSGRGRLGSGAYANARNDLDTSLGDTMSGLATDIYGGAYDNERNRMLQAAGMLPALDAARYTGANALANIGGMQDQKAQQIADLPWTNLGRYSSIIQGGNWGGTSTQTQPIHSNPFGSALGGALAGASLPIKGPWGMIGGGLLGLLG